MHQPQLVTKYPFLSSVKAVLKLMSSPQSDSYLVKNTRGIVQIIRDSPARVILISLPLKD